MIKKRFQISKSFWWWALPIIIAISYFSLGKIAWEIITKQTPLADENSLALLVAGKQLPRPAYETTAIFENEIIPVTDSQDTSSGVLGITSQEDYFNSFNRHIEVDLTRQKVSAFEGDNKVFEFDVSTGKWAPTPTGEFTIWAKVRSQKMSGGDKKRGTYYYLPNVPYVMFFANERFPKMRGFSLHGAYWHNNFGHPMSHGCINMRPAEAKTLYEWALPAVTNPRAWSTLTSAQNPGTKVVIYGETPKE